MLKVLAPICIRHSKSLYRDAKLLQKQIKYVRDKAVRLIQAHKQVINP